MNEELIEQLEDQQATQFDIDAMDLTDKLMNAHQEGNYLVGTTEKGVSFRHRIPHGKMLSQNDKGEFILIPLNIV